MGQNLIYFKYVILFLLYLSCGDNKTDENDQNEETESTYRFDIVYENTVITNT